MKKLIFLILALVLANSCCENNSYEAAREKADRERRIEKERTEMITKSIEEFYQSKCYLIDLTFEGNTHQFLVYAYRSGAMSHWPDCKYCKH